MAQKIIFMSFKQSFDNELMKMLTDEQLIQKMVHFVKMKITNVIIIYTENK